MASLACTQDLNAYPRKTYVFVPPVTYQQRFQATPCVGFARSCADKFETLRVQKCDGYDCGELASNPIFECVNSASGSHPAGENASLADTYFGSSPVSWHGSHVYAEFLHAFRSDVLVYRDVGGEATPLNLDAYINGRAPHAPLHTPAPPVCLVLWCVRRRPVSTTSLRRLYDGASRICPFWQALGNKQLWRSPTRQASTQRPSSR